MAAKQYEFTVRVRNAKSDTPTPTQHSIKGRSMSVNHRGDLIIHEGADHYSPAIACFRSGVWLEAKREA